MGKIYPSKKDIKTISFPIPSISHMYENPKIYIPQNPNDLEYEILFKPTTTPPPPPPPPPPPLQIVYIKIVHLSFLVHFCIILRKVRFIRTHCTLFLTGSP